MTRTARAAYPRAVIKDRSESRTGLDSSIRKSGAGHHNWGSLADELHLAAIGDLEEGETDSDTTIDSNSSTRCNQPLRFRFFSLTAHSFILAAISPQRQPENIRALTNEEVEEARNFRKNAFKTAGTAISP